jgi:putative flavoprotein involved in K+ transport
LLVVGCGNSGGQIAEDLVLAGRKVFLSTGRNGRIPRRYRGRDIFLWLTANGRMAKPRPTASGRGLLGSTHTISLQSLSAQGVQLLGRFLDVLPDGHLSVGDTLADSAAFGDTMAAMLRQEIDDYILRENIDAPEATPDPAERVAAKFPDPPILNLDLEAEGVTTVIWSTGLRGDYSWLCVPGALDDNGDPVQERGISVPGIYFAGLDTLASLDAGTIFIAAQEADRIVGHIAAANR